MILDCGDPEGMACAAADLFVRLAEQAIDQRGRFVVALAGGTTPKRTYELLAESPRRQLVQWGNVDIFWTDERCVLPEDERSNQRMARRLLLDRVPVPKNQIHAISWSGDSDQDALQYEKVLRSYASGDSLRFDLVLLGLGGDGHIASMFPGSWVLAEKRRWAVSDKNPGEEFSRITLTVPILNLARTIVFLLSGKAKAEALDQVLDKKLESLPATLIQPGAGDLFWLADREALSLLLPSRHLMLKVDSLMDKVSRSHR